VAPQVGALPEIIKGAMNHTNFVIACQDEDRFYSLFPAVREGIKPDFQERLDLVSLTGLISDIPNAGKQFNLEITGNGVPFLFTHEFCGGIPAYLHAWQDVNEVWEHIGTGDEEQAEGQALLLDKFEEVMSMLFVQEVDDNVELEITHCKRVERNTQPK
jgi:hypothetical protein